MKLSKVLSLVLSLLMVFTMSSFAASTPTFSDVDESASYAESVSVLTALKIITGYDENGQFLFKPENKIKRSEFAAIITRTLGMGDLSNNQSGGIFKDVAADYWASGYIAMAYQAGIINGMGDGTFAPEEDVTYEQVVKMLVCALGYNPKAASLGGYPTGYMLVANQESITVGTSMSSGGAPRSTVARLVNNALTVPMMDQTSWGKDASFQRIPNQSLLYSKLNAIKVDAKIRSIPLEKNERNVKLDYKTIDSVARADGWYAGKATTNYDIYLLNSSIHRNNVDLVGLQGLYVSAYIDISDDSTPKLIMATPKTGKNDYIDVKPSLLENKNASGYIEYYKNINDDKTTKERIDITKDGSVFTNLVVYNNLVEDVQYDATSSAVVRGGNTGDVVYRYVDTDADGSYDTVFVTNEKAFVIGSVNANSYKIFRDTTSSNVDTTFSQASITLDPTDDTVNATIKDVSGKELTFSDLKVGDVANVRVSKSGSVEYYEIIVTNDVINGAVSEVSTDTNKVTGNSETTFTIGGKEYKLFGNLTTLSPGDSIDAKIANSGKIISYEIAAENRKYGLIIATNIADEFGKTYQLQMMTSDGNLVVLNLAKNVNGVALTSSTYTTATLASEYPTGKLVVYDTNQSNEIKTIYTSDNSGFSAKYSGLKGVTITNDTYIESSERIGSNYFTDNTVFFAVDGATVAKDTVNLLNHSSLEDNEKYTGYAIVDDSRNIKTVVLLNAGNAVKWKSYPMMVKSVSSISVDGETRDRYTGYVNGEEVSVTVASDKSLIAIKTNDLILYVTNGAGEMTNAYKLGGVDSSKTYYDVVVTENNTKDDNKESVALADTFVKRLALAKTPSITAVDKNIAYGLTTQVHGFGVAGKAYQVQGKTLRLITDYEATFALTADNKRNYGPAENLIKDYSFNSGAIAYVFNPITNKVRVSSIADLETDRNTNDYAVVNPNTTVDSKVIGRDNDDSVYVYQYDGTTYAIVIVDAANDN